MALGGLLPCPIGPAPSDSWPDAQTPSVIGKTSPLLVFAQKSITVTSAPIAGVTRPEVKTNAKPLVSKTFLKDTDRFIATESTLPLTNEFAQYDSWMISGRHLAEFMIACVAIILVPGPSVMFTIARAVAWGRMTAVLTALGNSGGMLMLSVFIALGLGPLLQHSHLLLQFVQLLGGMYLIYLGTNAFRHREAHAADMVKVEEIKPSNFQIMREGFTVGVLNPKALVFFSAVFPQFVDPSLGSITVQLLVFGVIFTTLSFLLDGTWGFVVGSSRDWFVTSQNRLVVLRTIGAVVMMALGIGVIAPVVWSHFS